MRSPAVGPQQQQTSTAGAAPGTGNAWDMDDHSMLDDTSRAGAQVAMSYPRGSFSPNGSISSDSLDDPHSIRPGSGASMGSGLEGLGLGPVHPPADDAASTSSRQHGGVLQHEGVMQNCTFPGPMPMVSTQLRDHYSPVALTSSSSGAGQPAAQWEETGRGAGQPAAQWEETGSGPQLQGPEAPTNGRVAFLSSRTGSGPIAPMPRSAPGKNDSITTASTSSRSLATTTSSQLTASSQLQTTSEAGSSLKHNWGPQNRQWTLRNGQQVGRDWHAEGPPSAPFPQKPLRQTWGPHRGGAGQQVWSSGAFRGDQSLRKGAHGNSRGSIAASQAARAAAAASAPKQLSSVAHAAQGAARPTIISVAATAPTWGGGAASDAHHHLRASALDGGMLGVLRDSWALRQRTAVCRPVRFQTMSNESPEVGKPHAVLLESTLHLGAPHDDAGRSSPHWAEVEQLEADLARRRTQHALEERQWQLKEMARRREAAAREEIRRAREVRLQAAMAARIAERKSMSRWAAAGNQSTGRHYDGARVDGGGDCGWSEPMDDGD